MGKILACCFISLACFIGTGLAETQKKSRFSGFLSRSEVPEELKKYNIWEGKQIIYFGATWCAFCPSQKAILRTLEEKVTYCDADKDVTLFNHFRETNRKVPMTVIIVDGKIKKRFIGVHSASRIKKAYDMACDKDCNQCKDANF